MRRLPWIPTIAIGLALITATGIVVYSKFRTTRQVQSATQPAPSMAPEQSEAAPAARPSRQPAPPAMSEIPAFAAERPPEKEPEVSARRVTAQAPGPASPIGVWHNPNLPTVLRIGRKEWGEIPNNGGPPVSGQWERRPDGRMILASWNKNTVLAVRGGGNIIACQEQKPDGEMIGDGLVRIKEDVDWEGLRQARVPIARKHLQQLSGTWTHPNIKIEYQIAPNGQWVERRKNGGVHAQGQWTPLADGSYVVQLQGQEKRRVWSVEEELLGIISIQPNGMMDGDGTLVKAIQR